MAIMGQLVTIICPRQLLIETVRIVSRTQG
jgi:hypothetical protein